MTEINLWFVPYFFCFYEDRPLAFSRMILLFMGRIKKAKKPFTRDTLPNSFVTLSKETTQVIKDKVPDKHNILYSHLSRV